VFKLGVENDLRMSYKLHGFGIERSKVKVIGLRLTVIQRGYELCECLLVTWRSALPILLILNKRSPNNLLCYLAYQLLMENSHLDDYYKTLCW